MDKESASAKRSHEAKLASSLMRKLSSVMKNSEKNDPTKISVVKMKSVSDLKDSMGSTKNPTPNTKIKGKQIGKIDLSMFGMASSDKDDSPRSIGSPKLLGSPKTSSPKLHGSSKAIGSLKGIVSPKYVQSEGSPTLVGSPNPIDSPKQIASPKSIGSPKLAGSPKLTGPPKLSVSTKMNSSSQEIDSPVLITSPTSPRSPSFPLTESTSLTDFSHSSHSNTALNLAKLSHFKDEKSNDEYEKVSKIERIDNSDVRESNSSSGSENDQTVKIRHVSKKVDSSDVKRRSIGEQIAEIAQELGLREDDDEDDATTPTQDNYKSEISFEISELNKLSNVGRMSRTFSQSMSGSLPSGDTFSDSYTQDIKGPEYIQFKQKSSVYDVSDFRGENYNFSSDTTTRPDELNYLQNLSSSSSYIPTFQENKFDKNSKVYTSSSVNYSPKPNRKLIVKEMSLVTPESSKPSYVSNDQFQVKDYHKEQSNGGGHHLDQSEKDMFRKDLEQVLKTRSQPNSDSDEEEEYDESFLNDRTYAIIAEHALRRGSEKYGFASDDLIDVLSTIMEESDYHGSENVSLCGESVNGGDEQTSNGLPSFDVDDALSALERNRDSKDSEEFWKKYFQVDNRPSLTFTSNRAEKDIEDQQEHDVQSFDTRSVAQTNQSSKEVDVVVKEYEALSKRVDDILQKYRHFRNPSASDFQSSRLDVKQNNETESENYSLDYKPETSTDKSYRSTSYGYRLHSAIENTCNDKKETDASAEKYFETKESISPKTTKKKTIEEVIKAAEDLLSEEDDLDVSRRIRKRKKARRFNLTKWKDNEFSSDDDSVASAIENRASQLSLQILNKPDINCDVSDLRFSKDSGTNCTALKREKEETTHELREHDITKKGEVDLRETTKGTDQTLKDGSSSSSPYEELNSIASRLNKLKDRNQNVAGELERGHYALDFMRNEENSYQSLPEPSLKLESDTKNRDRTSSGYSYEDSSSKLEKRYENLSSVSSFDSVFQDSSVTKDVASPESQSVLDDDSYSSVSMYRRRLSRRSLTETCLSPEFKKDLESSRSTRSSDVNSENADMSYSERSSSVYSSYQPRDSSFSRSFYEPRYSSLTSNDNDSLYNYESEYRRRSYRGSSCVAFGTENNRDEYSFSRNTGSRSSDTPDGFESRYSDSRDLKSYGTANTKRHGLYLPDLNTSYERGAGGASDTRNDNRYYSRGQRARSECRFSETTSSFANRLTQRTIKRDTDAFKIQHFETKNVGDYLKSPVFQTKPVNEEIPKSDNILSGNQQKLSIDMKELSDSFRKFDRFMRKSTKERARRKTRKQAPHDLKRRNNQQQQSSKRSGERKSSFAEVNEIIKDGIGDMEGCEVSNKKDTGSKNGTKQDGSSTITERMSLQDSKAKDVKKDDEKIKTQKRQELIETKSSVRVESNLLVESKNQNGQDKKTNQIKLTQNVRKEEHVENKGEIRDVSKTDASKLEFAERKTYLGNEPRSQIKENSESVKKDKSVSSGNRESMFEKCTDRYLEVKTDTDKIVKPTVLPSDKENINKSHGQQVETTIYKHENIKGDNQSKAIMQSLKTDDVKVKNKTDSKKSKIPVGSRPIEESDDKWIPNNKGSVTEKPSKKSTSEASSKINNLSKRFEKAGKSHAVSKENLELHHIKEQNDEMLKSTNASGRFHMEKAKGESSSTNRIDKEPQYPDSKTSSEVSTTSPKSDKFHTAKISKETENGKSSQSNEKTSQVSTKMDTNLTQKGESSISKKAMLIMDTSRNEEKASLKSKGKVDEDPTNNSSSSKSLKSSSALVKADKMQTANPTDESENRSSGNSDLKTSEANKINSVSANELKSSTLKKAKLFKTSSSDENAAINTTFTENDNSISKSSIAMLKPNKMQIGKSSKGKKDISSVNNDLKENTVSAKKVDSPTLKKAKIFESLSGKQMTPVKDQMPRTSNLANGTKTIENINKAEQNKVPVPSQGTKKAEKTMLSGDMDKSIRSSELQYLHKGSSTCDDKSVSVEANTAEERQTHVSHTPIETTNTKSQSEIPLPKVSVEKSEKVNASTQTNTIVKPKEHLGTKETETEIAKQAFSKVMDSKVDIPLDSPRQSVKRKENAGNLQNFKSSEGISNLQQDQHLRPSLNPAQKEETSSANKVKNVKSEENGDTNIEVKKYNARQSYPPGNSSGKRSESIQQKEVGKLPNTDGHQSESTTSKNKSVSDVSSQQSITKSEEYMKIKDKTVIANSERSHQVPNMNSVDLIDQIKSRKDSFKEDKSIAKPINNDLISKSQKLKKKEVEDTDSVPKDKYSKDKISTRIEHASTTSGVEDSSNSVEELQQMPKSTSAYKEKQGFINRDEKDGSSSCEKRQTQSNDIALTNEQSLSALSQKDVEKNVKLSSIDMRSNLEKSEGNKEKFKSVGKTEPMLQKKESNLTLNDSKRKEETKEINEFTAMNSKTQKRENISETDKRKNEAPKMTKTVLKPVHLDTSSDKDELPSSKDAVQNKSLMTSDLKQNENTKDFGKENEKSYGKDNRSSINDNTKVDKVSKSKVRNDLSSATEGSIRLLEKDNQDQIQGSPMKDVEPKKKDTKKKHGNIESLKGKLSVLFADKKGEKQSSDGVTKDKSNVESMKNKHNTKTSNDGAGKRIEKSEKQSKGSDLGSNKIKTKEINVTDKSNTGDAIESTKQKIPVSNVSEKMTKLGLKKDITEITKKSDESSYVSATESNKDKTQVSKKSDEFSKINAKDSVKSSKQDAIEFSSRKIQESTESDRSPKLGKIKSQGSNESFKRKGIESNKDTTKETMDSKGLSSRDTIALKKGDSQGLQDSVPSPKPKPVESIKKGMQENNKTSICDGKEAKDSEKPQERITICSSSVKELEGSGEISNKNANISYKRDPKRNDAANNRRERDNENSGKTDLTGYNVALEGKSGLSKITGKYKHEKQQELSSIAKLDGNDSVKKYVTTTDSIVHQVDRNADVKIKDTTTKNVEEIDKSEIQSKNTDIKRVLQTSKTYAQSTVIESKSAKANALSHSREQIMSSIIRHEKTGIDNTDKDLKNLQEITQVHKMESVKTEQTSRVISDALEDTSQTRNISEIKTETVCVEGNLQALDDQINRIERSDKDGERSCSDSVFESESMSEQSVITIRQDTSCAVSVPNGEVEKEDSASQIKAVDRRLDSIDDKESGYYSKLQIDDLDRSQTVRDSVNSWLDRYHVPMTREPSKAYEYKVIEEDFSLPNRTYIDHLTTYIPPRLPIEKPDLYTMTPETATLSWKPAKVPDRIRNTCNLTYSIEVRNPPGLDWRELVSGLTSTNYDLKNLHPRLDYLFRIRAHNEYGCSEPCLPVSLHRPIELSDDEFDIEDWDDPYRISLGQLDAPIDEAPPKLPMEAPRITDNGVTAHLSWLAARIPAYAKKTPITYIVEIKEPNIPGWSRVSSGITDTNYFVEDLLQNKDYQFRVKAETQFGVSDPTLPVSLERSKNQKRQSVDYRKEEADFEVSTKPSFSGVPPRMPSSRPLICHRHGNSISLSWNPGRVPSYVKNSKMTYVVEIREPPSPLWRVLADNLTDNDFDINNLEPDQDYMFRVRAKNDFGLSEPTLPASVFREKDDYTPPTLSRSRSGSASPWVGGSRASSVDRQRSFSLTDDDLDIHVNRDRKPCPPEFKTPVETTQYGVEGRAAKLILPLRGYPLPRVSWFYMGERLECGDLFKASVSPAGMANLDIQRMSQERVGDYKCCEENEHGVAVKIVRLLLADQPTIIEPMKNLSLGMRGSGKFECRVDGTPYPTVKFLKDMRPVVGSSRVKIDHTPPDLWTLTIGGAMSMDAGTYTCIAENMAGKVSSVARINIADEDEEDSETVTMETPIKEKLCEEDYYVLEEIGRGRHGVVRRVVDKITGGEYAAKFIPVADDRQRQFFMHELRNLRSIEHKGVPRVVDLYQTERRLVIVMDFITGGNILSYVIRRKNQIEEDVAYYTEQLLLILKYLHGNNILHLDIKPSSVHFIEKGSDNICLLDFGFSRNFSKVKDVRLNFGSVDFTSPEQITNDRVSPATDMWNVGLLVHTLLSGESPFHDKTEADSLRRIQECDWSFDEDYFDGISTEARDFIKKLLLKEPSERMSLADCLSHPFIKGDCEDGQGQKLNTERLRAYSKTLRERKSKHLLQTTANLVSLQLILDNKDVVQPVLRGQSNEAGGITYPESSAYGEFLDDESWFDWQSRSFGGDEDSDAQTDSQPVWRDPSVLKEEEWSSVAEDYKQQIQKPQDFFPKEEMDADNPQFLTKLGNLLFRPGEDITLTCRVSKEDSLTVSWYRNEELLSESNRVKVTMSDGGEASLVVCGAKPYDDGLYKCVVRSKTGKSSTWARVLVGELPSQPYRPIITQVSTRDALLLWESPITDADIDIKHYRVDYKEKGTEEWLIGGYTVDQMALVSGLMADFTYQFRVCATNTIGSGPYSVSSLPTKTLKDDSEEIELEPLETILLSKQNPQAHETVTCDYEPKELTLKEENIENTYKLSETFYRGQFSEFSLAKEAVTNKYFVSKQIIQSDSNKDTIQRELEILRLNQSNQRILRLLDCFIYNSNIYFIHEYFCGVNIVEHFAFKTKYSEDMVAIAIQQVLDGVQFLHQNNIVHLNLQPSSIVMRRRSSLDVRITDFTLAQTVDSKEGLEVPVNGNPEFLAPEVVVQEKVSYPADIWTVGDLTFLLLSGESPYYGRKKDVTLSNIAYNRYNPLALYENITRDALRFIFKVLKRTPRNRMTVDACLEDRWLQGKDSIVKTRQEAIFTTAKLRTYIERTLTDADEDALPTLKELRKVFELTEDKRHRFSVPERSFDVEELEKKETKITLKGDEGSVDKDKPEVATDQPESKEIIDTIGEVKDSTETDDKTDDKDGDKDDGTSQTSSDRIEQVADDLVATAVKDALHSGEISTKGVEDA